MLQSMKDHAHGIHPKQMVHLELQHRLQTLQLRQILLANSVYWLRRGPHTTPGRDKSGPNRRQVKKGRGRQRDAHVR